MRGIDETLANLLHESMSRPLSHFLPVACATVSLGFTACVGTIYDRTYTNKKTYFKPPPEKKEVSAEAILSQVDSKPGAAPATDPAGLPPADAGAGAVPGLPPPAAAGDIPGLPPASPMAPPP